MKLFNDQLAQTNTYSNLFQKVLTESIDGDTGILYHRSPSESYHEFLLDNKVEFGKRVGLLDGPGIYTTYKLSDQFNDRMIDLYGEYIFELKMNLSRVLFFDWDAFKKTSRYNSNFEEDDFILGQFRELEINPTRKSDASLAITLQRELNNLRHKNTSDIAHEFSQWYKEAAEPSKWGLKGPVSGIVFTGRQDGRVAVIWNAYASVPFQYCYAPRPNMRFKELKWINIEHENMDNYSQNAEKHATERHPLQKYLKISTWREFDEAVSSDEIQELIQLSGGTLNDSKYYRDKLIIRINLSDDQYNKEGFSIMPNGEILWNDAGSNKKEIKGRASNFYQAVQMMIEKVKDPIDPDFHYQQYKEHLQKERELEVERLMQKEGPLNTFYTEVQKIVSEPDLLTMHFRKSDYKSFLLSSKHSSLIYNIIIDIINTLKTKKQKLDFVKQIEQNLNGMPIIKEINDRLDHWIESQNFPENSIEYRLYVYGTWYVAKNELHYSQLLNIRKKIQSNQPLIKQKVFLNENDKTPQDQAWDYCLSACKSLFDMNKPFVLNDVMIAPAKIKYSDNYWAHYDGVPVTPEDYVLKSKTLAQIWDTFANCINNVDPKYRYDILYTLMEIRNYSNDYLCDALESRPQMQEIIASISSHQFWLWYYDHCVSLTNLKNMYDYLKEHNQLCSSKEYEDMIMKEKVYSIIGEFVPLKSFKRILQKDYVRPPLKQDYIKSLG